MSDNSLAIRFSDEKYCTRAEVASTLGTNLIEPIWNDILLYRKQFRKQINVYDITKVPFTITYVPSILKRLNDLEEKTSEYIVSFGGLSDGSTSRYNVLREMNLLELRQVAKANKININEVALNNIIEFTSVDRIYEPLVKYFSAIVHLDKNPRKKLSEELINEYYSILSGEDLIDTFYRKSEINNSGQRFLINREYAGAPTQDIPVLMKNLVNYVNNSSDSFIVKISVAIYMINYVKPFEKYNSEMASIIAKIIIASNDVESAAVYIPLETINVDENKVLNDISREIQRSRDLTYEVTRIMDFFENALEVVADKIVQVNVADAQKSYLLGESKEEFEEEFGFTPNEGLFENQYSTNAEVKPENVQTKSEESVRPVKPAKTLEPIERKKELPEEELSDKQLRKMAQNLLEEDPLLKKGQAHFYVRHCTKGKYYTIQQYKKCEGCVYETARTSMDMLARLGYYRREQVKNKFVYTPIDKE